MTSLCWFRRDLRLADNPAFDAAGASDTAGAAAGTGGGVLGVFVVDPVPWASAGPLRRDLLVGHLESLDRALGELGGSLAVLHGDPVEVLPRLVEAFVSSGHPVSAVHVNGDTTPYSTRRDTAVGAALGTVGVPLRTWWGCHVHAPGTVTAGSTGRVHQVFTPFFRAWAARERDPWPDPPGGGGSVCRVLRGSDLAGPLHAGIPPTDGEPVMAPGEEAAESRLQRWCDRADGYDERRNLPADDEGTSHLSADLRWGTLSPRHVADVVGTGTKARAAFVRQLAWRDWYAHLLADRPELATSAMRPEGDRVPWRSDPDGLAAWVEGRTGYPIVDAGMRQLAATGWMHNRVRMLAASFLSKDLLVDWRRGEAHFRRLLVDYDLPQNVGNWQWVAGTGPDAAPYFRVFNPVTQGRRFDPAGDYVRRWVPELAGLGGTTVHAPWEVAPLDLAAAGVVLGETYPMPIVDHAEGRDRAIAAHEAARAATSADEEESTEEDTRR